MTLRIEADTPALVNDLSELARLFFGEGAVRMQDAEGTFTLSSRGHRERTDILMLHAPGVNEEEVFSYVLPEEDVEAARVRRFQVKRAVYRLLCRVTGKSFPWGSLTGVRPVKLFKDELHRLGDLPRVCRYFEEELQVSREKTGLLTEILRNQGDLGTLRRREVDLYVGIPFCTTRCSYCSFSSGLLGRGELAGRYVDALLDEIQQCAELCGRLGLRIRTAYMGGGTPTSLSTAQLDRVLAAVEGAFGPFTEWTVEAGRPDTLSREKLAMLRTHPVTRICLNPQTLHVQTLRRIGRGHTVRQFEDMFALARSLGFDRINTDLIAALPGEDLGMFRETLNGILALAPEEVTVHTLCIKRSSRLHEMLYRVESEDAEEMLRLAHTLLGEAGYGAYYLYRQKYAAGSLENVGYALPGAVCRYNIDNMEDLTCVLALGAGAISKRLGGEGERILHAPNVSNIDAYIARVDEMVRRKEAMFCGFETGEYGC